MTCQYCGAEMRDGSVLCTACGRLTKEFERTYRRPDPTVGGQRASYTRSYTPEVSSAANSGLPVPPRRLIAIVLAAIAVIAAFSIVLGTLMPDASMEQLRAVTDERYIPGDYEEILDQYFSAVGSGDAEEICTLRPEALRDETPAGFDVLADRYGTLVLKYQINSRRMHDSAEIALLEYRLGETVTAFDELEVSVLMDDRDEPELLRVDLVTLEDGSTYLYQVRTANEVALP